MYQNQKSTETRLGLCLALATKLNTISKLNIPSTEKQYISIASLCFAFYSIYIYIYTYVGLLCGSGV